MNLFCLFVFNMLHDHVKSQLIIDEVTIAAFETHALVEVCFFVLAHSAVDVVDELVVDPILLG